MLWSTRGVFNTMRRGSAVVLCTALVLVALLVVACGSDDEGGSNPTSTTASTTPTSTEGTASSPLAGEWRTASVSPTDAEKTLSRSGLSEWIDEFRTRAPFEGETVLVLEIGEEWDLYGASDDGTRAEIDFDASYEVDGDEVVVTHSAGSNTFRWEIVGGTLTLELLESSMPAFEGIPEEVFQRALYMTAEFTRAP